MHEKKTMHSKIPSGILHCNYIAVVAILCDFMMSKFHSNHFYLLSQYRNENGMGIDEHEIAICDTVTIYELIVSTIHLPPSMREPYDLCVCVILTQGR